MFIVYRYRLVIFFLRIVHCDIGYSTSSRSTWTGASKERCKLESCRFACEHLLLRLRADDGNGSAAHRLRGSKPALPMMSEE